MSEKQDRANTPGGGTTTRWYDLFSRGARDWLRHNQKLRDSMKEALPELLSHLEVSGPGDRKVQVPVRLLEHYRFRLRDREVTTGAGQGQGVKPGDVLQEGKQGQPTTGSRGAGTGHGGLELVLELKVDELLDWLWEELQLPNLEPRPGRTLVDEELVREGWNRRGARSRLDRRRTLKEAIKRRAAHPESPPFTDDDLRFRQVTRRLRPSTEAVIVFVLDVSSSMGEEPRKLAKNFFFWTLQCLRRQYRQIETAFVAHTIEAWEFSEQEFFQVRGSGGTRASVGFELARKVLHARYHPSRYNAYVLYASDGDNFPEDREAVRRVLDGLAAEASFMGYLEVAERGPPMVDTEMGRLFRELRSSGRRVGSYAAHSRDELWQAVRRFFVDQIDEAA